MSAMPFELSIQREFCAAHAIHIRGRREPVHGHNWRVRLWVRAESLDEDGLIVDFHELENALDAVIAPWHNADLNAVDPFDRLNPTAEHVAREIAQRVREKMGFDDGSPHDVSRVEVSEAPGCYAIYTTL